MSEKLRTSGWALQGKTGVEPDFELSEGLPDITHGIENITLTSGTSGFGGGLSSGIRLPRIACSGAKTFLHLGRLLSAMWHQSWRKDATGQAARITVSPQASFVCPEANR
jgi:hypothetical protein